MNDVAAGGRMETDDIDFVRLFNRLLVLWRKIRIIDIDLVVVTMLHRSSALSSLFLIDG